MLRYVNEPEKGSPAEDPDEQVESPSFYNEDSQKARWQDKILLNRPSKVIFVLALFTILAPTLLYFFLLTSTLDIPPTDGFSTGSCLLPRTLRIPCGKGQMAASECHSQCCYDEENGMCFHRLPSRFSYIMDREWTETSLLQPRVLTEPFASQVNINNLRISVNEISTSHLSITFFDPQKVQVETGIRLEEKNYVYEMSSPELNINVTANQGVIFSTERGPLIAAPNIWEIAFKLTNDTMFGLGEIPLHDIVKIVYSSSDSIDGLPLIFARFNGSFHGLLVENDTPTEITVLMENQIVVRTLSDRSLKLHLFIGPTPKDIMQDVMKLTGGAPEVPYWMLGANFCSKLTDDLSIEKNHLESFLQGAATDNLPFDAHCGLGPIVLGNLLKENEALLLNEGATAVTSANKHLVPHLSPYIHNIKIAPNVGLITHYEANNEAVLTEYESLFLRNTTSDEPYQGLVNTFSVLYPDYSLDNSSDLLQKLWYLEEDIDGIVLENSWPLDESKKTIADLSLHLPYFSKALEQSFNLTLPWNISHIGRNTDDLTLHMYNHNKYGQNFVDAFQRIKNATYIWSTSQWMDTRITQNRQNIDTSWTNLRRELIQAALGGVSGHWLWSTPICGDTENFDPNMQTELCIKWYLAGTYFPVFKVRSQGIRKDPLAFTGTNKAHMINALNIRSSFMPYYFMVLQTGPLLRPMFYQFPDSNKLHHLSTQFSVGDDLLIVPNLLPEQTHVNVWLPPGTWYEVWSGLKMEAEENDAVTMATTTGDFLSLIRGGSIIILQQEIKPTAEATRRESSYSIVIALECQAVNETEINAAKNDSRCHAEGILRMSEDMSLLFTADEKNLTIKPEGDNFSIFCDFINNTWAPSLKDIKIYGLDNSLNNYDTYRQISSTLYLCILQMTGQSIIQLV